MIIHLWLATTFVRGQLDVFDEINEEAAWDVFDQETFGNEDDGTVNDGAGYNYAQVLNKNYKFFYAQMSGKLPANYPIDWRGDSSVNDGKDAGLDLSGGYYDGGGFVKYNFPMAFSTTMLAWSTIKYWRTIHKLNEQDAALTTLRWGTDYLIKCHPEKNVFYVQVSDKSADETYWGRAEDISYERKSYKIDGVVTKGTEPVAEAAAALAAASIVFRNIDSYYADDLLEHAEQLFNLMAWPPGKRRKYHESISVAAKAYKSWTGFYDELVWAAVWLFKATKKPQYQIKAELMYKNNHLDRDISLFSWDNKVPGIHILLAEITNKPNYKNTMKLFCRDKMPGGAAKRTPLGMVYLGDWGALRYAAASGGLCYVVSDMKIDPDANRDFAKSQLDYILGDTGKSFIIGFGTEPPTKYYHKGSYCPPAPEHCGSFTGIPNRHPLEGGLVGGPDEFDRFENDPWKQQQSSVALDYNAVFTFLILGHLDQELFPNSRPRPLKPGRPLRTELTGNNEDDYMEPSGPVNLNDHSSGKSKLKAHDYLSVISKTLLFYEAQRASDPNGFKNVPWRANATLQDNSDDANLAGGFFDGAGTMKYTFPLAYSMTMISWSLIEYELSFNHYGANLKEIIREGIRWLVEANSDSNKIYAVVGNHTFEEHFWGRAEDVKGVRQKYYISESKPGSDLAGEVAAAFAAASIVFSDEPDYKEMLISKASSLIQFAEQYKGRYTDSVPSASKYGSRSYEDELAWANLWMYKATAQESYLDAAKNLVEIHDELQSNPKIFNVDTKVAGVQLLLAMEESADLTIHTDRVKNFCNFYVNDVPKTVRGLAFPTTFGATSVASSSSFLCILAAQKLPYEKIGVEKISWIGYGIRQVNYILGSGGRSYLVGYGANYPTQPLHKGSSCPTRPIQCTADPYKTRDAPNMQILKGALVSGPNDAEEFLDKRSEPKYTTVSLDRNAVFTAALGAVNSVTEADTAQRQESSSNLNLSISPTFLLMCLAFSILN